MEKAGTPPSTPGRMDDITNELRDSHKPLNGGPKPPTYKSLDEVTPTLALAKVKAWKRLESAVESLKHILPPGKMDPVPLRIIVEFIMDPEHAKWYFQPDLEKEKAELGVPLPCDRPQQITRSELAVYMLHAPVYLNFVYGVIDRIGDLGLAYYLAHEKMRFTPPPRHAVDSVTDSIVGAPAFIVDHYMLVVNVPETRRRHLSPALPRSFVGGFSRRTGTPRPTVYEDSSDYDDDWGWAANAGAESDSDSAAATGGLTILPHELTTATSSRSLPPLNRGRLVAKE